MVYAVARDESIIDRMVKNKNFLYKVGGILIFVILPLFW